MGSLLPVYVINTGLKTGRLNYRQMPVYRGNYALSKHMVLIYCYSVVLFIYIQIRKIIISLRYALFL